MKRIVLLGATGSIGRQTLDVLSKHPDEFSLVGICAGHNAKELKKIAEAFPSVEAIGLFENKEGITFSCDHVFYGEDNMVQCLQHCDYDLLVNAVVGFRGLKPTLESLRQGKDVALANKESLVAGGVLVKKMLERTNTKLYPIDSEHSAIFQSMAGRDKSELRRILLTGSGGPFRGWTPEQTKDVTPERAVRHPNWSMGAKISIDSATMMNKGLEFIEAMHLFAVTPEQIRVVIHPESAIHSMVELLDGTVIAQLGVPDMGLPIQYALTYPERRESAAKPMDFAALGSMHFEDPDLDKLPCLRLAMECARARGTAPCVLSAANEIAVGAFLGHRIGYNDIYRVVASAVERAAFIAQPTLEEILASDAQARELVRREIG